MRLSGGTILVIGFNTLYAGVVVNGELVTPEPATFVWSEKLDCWYNKKLDLRIDWVGFVVGPISYLSSRDRDEVISWIEANSQPNA